MNDLSASLVTNSTRLIRVLTDEFNLSLSDLRQIHREVMWGTNVSEEFVMTLGYAVVHSRQPEGQGDYIEITPTLEDGLYYQNWELRTDSPAEVERKLAAAKDSLNTIVKEMSTQAIARGMPFNFGTEEKPSILHVQIRDADRLNIMGMIVRADRNPGIVQAFRTAENIMVGVSAEQLIAMSDSAYDGYLAIKGAEWALLDAASAATVISAVPAAPESFRHFYETNAGLQWVEQSA